MLRVVTSRTGQLPRLCAQNHRSITGYTPAEQKKLAGGFAITIPACVAWYYFRTEVIEPMLEERAAERLAEKRKEEAADTDKQGRKERPNWKAFQSYQSSPVVASTSASDDPPPPVEPADSKMAVSGSPLPVKPANSNTSASGNPPPVEPAGSEKNHNESDVLTEHHGKESQRRLFGLLPPRGAASTSLKDRWESIFPKS
jgi:hypothetical protein